MVIVVPKHVLLRIILVVPLWEQAGLLNLGHEARLPKDVCNSVTDSDVAARYVTTAAAHQGMFPVYVEGRSTEQARGTCPVGGNPETATHSSSKEFGIDREFGSRRYSRKPCPRPGLAQSTDVLMQIPSVGTWNEQITESYLVD